MINRVRKTIKSMADHIRARPYMAGLVFISFVFLILNAEVFPWAEVIPTLEFLDIISTVCFLIYALAYVICNGVFSDRAKTMLKIVALIFIVDLCATFWTVGQADLYFLAIFYSIFVKIFVLFMVATGASLLIYITLFAGRYLPAWLICMLFLMALLLLIACYYPGLVYTQYLISDEMYIVYADVGAFLHGANPYASSVAVPLYANLTEGHVFSATLTTTNQIVGVLNYPALYLFAIAPFYLLTAPTPQNFDLLDTGMALAVSLFVLLVVIALSIRKSSLKDPAYSIMFFVALVMNVYVSAIPGIFLALIVLAYKKLDSRYAWLFLGLCASAQELLWFPVALLILYSANNSGIRKGAYNLAGAALVFLVINSYFIALNPAAFFRGVVTPVDSSQLANTGAPIGYLYTVMYGASQNVSALVFVFVMIELMIAFAYFNNKKLVGLFALIPFVFLNHALPNYFAYFVCLTFIVLFIDDKGRRGYGTIGSFLRKKGGIACGLVLLVALVPVSTVLASHAAYRQMLNLSVAHQSIYANAGSNAIVYTGTLTYHNLSNDTLYLLLSVGSNHGFSTFGFANSPLIKGSVNCTGVAPYPCQVNLNRIELNPANDTYRITAQINKTKNLTVYNASVMLYSGNYIYVS